MCKELTLVLSILFSLFSAIQLTKSVMVPFFDKGGWNRLKMGTFLSFLNLTIMAMFGAMVVPKFLCG